MSIEQKTMRAVVLKGDYHVEVEDRPVPQIREPTDAILRVTSTALCGSDLHFYRGHLKCPPGFICGHEFVGEVVAKGDAVKQFDIGDKVVVPFYTACGACYYCVRGQASRCAKGELFGNSAPANTVDGGQAEFVRCPLADTTFVRPPEGIPEEMLVLMAISSRLVTSPRHVSSKTSLTVTDANSQWSRSAADRSACAPSRVR